jgi:protein arginine N-methyltransferase 1
MYSLSGYGEMVADRVRMEAYAQALRGAVRPGSVVLDIGTGPGIMAVLACQLGAGRVYAIEPSPIINLARQIAAANCCADKIEFIEDVSTRVTLPVLTDVIVSDLRGILPLFSQHIPSIVDARRRLLAPGGTLIPRKDLLWVSVVEAPERYARIVDDWEHNVLGQDLSPARQRAVNDCRKARLTPQQLLTKPQLWARLKYATVESPDVQGQLHCTVERGGTGHGFLIWFETELSDGIGFSNAPGEPELIYGSMFFPWPSPVALTAGQTVCIHLVAKLMENDYMWRWTTQVGSPDGAGVVVNFDQSQLQAMLLSPTKLKKAASDYVPRLSEEGILHQKTLTLMDGKTSLEEIARQLAAEFPQRFSRWQEALSYAGAVSQEHSL